MNLSKDPELKLPRRLNALLLFACFLLPTGGTYAQNGAPQVDADVRVVGAPQPGEWRASSKTADVITGNIRVTESGITFANGTSISIEPAYPGARNIFKIDPAADPLMVDGSRLCKSPITYVTLLTYHNFALAVHMYDSDRLPLDPTPANIPDIARRGKCASYYYRRQVS